LSVLQTMDESAAERFCVGCGYNLRGISSEQCPECGLRIDAGGGTRIAWEARRELGRINALWLTCVQAIFQVKPLARAVGQPVDSKSAVLFRVIVSAAVTVPLSVVFLIVVHLNGGTGFLSPWQPNGWTTSSFISNWWWEPAILWSAGTTIIFVGPVAGFITVYLGTGVLGYWVKNGEMSVEWRRRGVAVSAYVAAPLVLLAVPTGAFCLA